jgi:hypothetical protein
MTDETIHTAQCGLCVWKFTHPDVSAVDIEMVDHLITKHHVDPSEIHVTT